MQIFAHRGLLHQYPENSYPALIKALTAGYAIETDLRLTKDHDLVIIHDDNAKRLTGQDLIVKNLTLSQCKNLPYTNSSENLISFRALLKGLKKFGSTQFHAIHLKSDCQTEIGLQTVVSYWQEFDLYDRAFVFDLTLASARRLKKLDRKIKIALIVSEYQFEPTIHLWQEVKSLSDFDFVWAAEYRYFYSKDLILQMKKQKEKVYAMSPDVHKALGHPLAFHGYQKTWVNLFKWGIDGICTDEPVKLKKYYPI